MGSIHTQQDRRREAQRKRRASAPACSEAGCDRKSFCKGMCSMHYERQRKACPAIVCETDGCASAVHGHGLCMNHYLKARRRKLVPSKPCTIDGCERAAESKGLCAAHSIRVLKYGDPGFRKRVANGEQTPERMRETRKKCQQNYRATPHGKLRAAVKHAKRRASEGLEFASLTREQSAALWAQTNCGICSHPVSDADKSVDHKIPLARGGTNHVSNLQITHLRCNQRKGNRLILQEAA